MFVQGVKGSDHILGDPGAASESKGEFFSTIFSPRALTLSLLTNRP